MQIKNAMIRVERSAAEIIFVQCLRKGGIALHSKVQIFAAREREGCPKALKKPPHLVERRNPSSLTFSRGSIKSPYILPREDTRAV